MKLFRFLLVFTGVWSRTQNAGTFLILNDNLWVQIIWKHWRETWRSGLCEDQSTEGRRKEVLNFWLRCGWVLVDWNKQWEVFQWAVEISVILWNSLRITETDARVADGKNSLDSQWEWVSWWLQKRKHWVGQTEKSSTFLWSVIWTWVIVSTLFFRRGWKGL